MNNLLTQLETDQKLYVILEGLRDKGFEAYVAGGYCRDTYLGHDYRDIDIFVKTDPTYKEDTVFEVLEYFGKLDLALYTNTLGDYEGQETVFEQYTFEYQDLPLNIIFRDFENLDNLLETFNFGINMIGMEIHRWYFTPKFINDVARQIITIYKPDDPSNNVRLESLREKYPWPSVNDEHLTDKEMIAKAKDTLELVAA